MTRIKTIKLRGIWSYGLLIPNTKGYPVGTDVTQELGVLHYTPDVERNDAVSNGETCKAPECVTLAPTPSLEHLKKYYKLIPVGTRVQISEKIDGSFSEFVYTGGQFHIRSMNNWKREYPDTTNLSLDFFISKGKTPEEAQVLVDNVNSKPKKQCKWWASMRKNQPLMDFLMKNPDTFVFGELFGNVNRIKYNLPTGDRIAVFEMWKDGQFLAPNDTLKLCKDNGIDHVPILEEDFEFTSVEPIIEMAEGKTLIPDAKPGTIREGLVVKPLVEINHYRHGRVALKCHSPSFLLI